MSYYSNRSSTNQRLRESYLKDWWYPPRVYDPRPQVLPQADEEQHHRDAQQEGEEQELNDEHGWKKEKTVKIIRFVISFQFYYFLTSKVYGEDCESAEPETADGAAQAGEQEAQVVGPLPDLEQDEKLHIAHVCTCCKIGI